MQVCENCPFVNIVHMCMYLYTCEHMCMNIVHRDVGMYRGICLDVCRLEHMCSQLCTNVCIHLCMCIQVCIHCEYKGVYTQVCLTHTLLVEGWLRDIS